MIKEHERVVFEVSRARRRAGSRRRGTVVHIYRDGLAYEVEFTTLEGDTAAVVTVEAVDVRPVHKREITHARELVHA